jgi:hypothetical protein
MALHINPGTSTIEGTLNDYVGINVERTAKDEYHLSQPNIINSILKELSFDESIKAAKTPAHSTTVLGPGIGKEKHKADWMYRRIIGKLNFLAVSCRPEISCAVHQAARYSHDPRINHTEAVKRICRYLKSQPDKGMYCDQMDIRSKYMQMRILVDFGEQ